MTYRLHSKKSIASLALILLYLVCTGWRLQYLIWSFESLSLTIVMAVTGRGPINAFINFGIAEYWLAAIVWVVFGVWYIAKQIRELRKASRHVAESGTDQYDSQKKNAYSKQYSVLLTWLFLFLVIPLLAPFDPTTQGDLRSTRFLHPLEKATVTVNSTEEFSSDGLSRSIEIVNAHLLHQKEEITLFSRDRSKDEVPPSGEVRTYFFGTDNLGRDIFSRLLYGARISIGIGFASMLITVIIGCGIGFVSGIAGGWIDRVLMRFTDLCLAIPVLFLVIMLVAFWGNSFALLVAVLAVTGWMGTARLVRGEIVSLREREFILAARMLGCSQWEIIISHLLPNVLPMILVAAVLQFGNILLAEAALSFLGLGIQPPTPSLGNILGEAMPYIGSAWWLSLFPGIMLSMIIISLNSIAERNDVPGGFQ